LKYYCCLGCEAVW